jgi:ABC-type proline/glycine betaine transport system permease subunit
LAVERPPLLDAFVFALIRVIRTLNLGFRAVPRGFFRFAQVFGNFAGILP